MRWIVLLFLTLNTLSAYPPENNLNRGLTLISEKRLDEAEACFRSMLKKDKKTAEAWYGLGRVYEIKEPDCRQARYFYEKAVRRNRAYDEAWYRLGLAWMPSNENKYFHVFDNLQRAVKLNPAHIDAWISMADIYEIFEHPSKKAVEILYEGVTRNRQCDRLYHHFIDAVYWNHREKQAMKRLQALHDQMPGNPWPLYHLARLALVFESMETSRLWIEKLTHEFPNFSTALTEMLQARLAFEAQENRKGETLFWSAASAIHDSLDARRFIHDHQYLMQKDEIDVFESLEYSEFEPWLRRFWVQRDPDLSTEVNERLGEHFRRWTVAHKQYGYYLTLPDHKSLHPDADSLFRGLIFLRHGRRDTWNVYSAGTGIGESWKYEARYDRPKMVFHFYDFDDKGYQLLLRPLAYQNFSEFGNNYARIENSMDEMAFTRMMFSQGELAYHEYDSRRTRILKSIQDLSEEIESECDSCLQAALNSESSDYHFKGKPLDIPLQLASFKRGDSARVTLFYYLKGDAFSLDTTSGSGRLRFQKFCAFHDAEWTEEVRVKKEGGREMDLTPEAWQRTGAVEAETFLLKPGEHHFYFKIEDRVSGQLAEYKGPITVPDYLNDAFLAMSDVILSSEIGEEESGVFRQGDVVYSPHMFTAFWPEEPVGLYFELYNLLPDRNGFTDYAVTWTVQEEGADIEQALSRLIARLLGSRPEKVSSTLVYQGHRADEPVFINLDLSGRDPGVYEVVIHARDRVSDETVNKTVKVTISDPTL